MLTSTVSEQGQTTIPADVRKALKAPPGTVLTWSVSGSTAEVAPLTQTDKSQRSQIDYEVLIQSWKESPPVPDHLLKIRRSKE